MNKTFTESVRLIMGLNESGGAVLRRTVFRIFEQWCFVESVVLKCPAFVKPRNVIGKRIGRHNNH